MSDCHKKSEFIHGRATPEQLRRVQTHCDRLGVSVGARLLELFRLDILSHHHFDLGIDVGPVRKPKAMRAAA
jgi:hypothetical protein